jgi:hypothetical protein
VPSIEEGLLDSRFFAHSDVVQGPPNSSHRDGVLAPSIEAYSCLDSRRKLTTVHQYSQKQRVSVSQLPWSTSVGLPPSNRKLFGQFVDCGLGDPCLLSNLANGLVLFQKAQGLFDSGGLVGFHC